MCTDQVLETGRADVPRFETVEVDRDVDVDYKLRNNDGVNVADKLR